MPARPLVAAAAVMGGVVWAVRWLTANTAEPDLLRWIGLALVLLASLGVGASLVRASNLALRLLVALCFAALVWALVELLTGAGGTLALGLAGVTIASVGVVGLLGSRRRPETGGAHGAHGAHGGGRSHRGDGEDRRGNRAGGRRAR